MEYKEFTNDGGLEMTAVNSTTKFGGSAEGCSAESSEKSFEQSYGENILISCFECKE